MAEEDNLRNINVFGENLSVKQEMFDVAHPIGEIYIQLPKQKDPMTLYNKNGVTSTWSYDKTDAGVGADYAGAFFRTEGGSACTFNENALNLQSNAFKCHCHGGYTGCLTNSCTTSGMSGDSYACTSGGGFFGDVQQPHGRLSSNKTADRNYQNASGATNGWWDICINLSHTHTFNHTHTISCEGNNETRPDNYTMRIWKRIS